ncbi:MAG: apolipoprotein N-acyltransferase, partial [Pseudomonadota bacterium]
MSLSLGTYSGLAIIFGAIASQAMPPASLLVAVPALVIGLGGLLWLLAGISRPAQAGFAGWLFGFILFLMTLNWIAEAPGIYDPKLAAFGLVGVIALASAMALYIAIPAIIAVWLYPKRGTMRLVALIVLLGLAEWLRGHLFTGFPWHLWAHALTPSPALMQLAALVGVYGVSGLTLSWVGLWPAAIWLWQKGHKRSARAIFLAVIILPACAILWGTWRIETATLQPQGTLIRIVQPNIEQQHKWNPAAIAEHFAIQLELTAQPAEGQAADFVIWPETATIFNLAEHLPARRAIGQAIGEGSVALIGSYFHGKDEGSRNSLLALDDQGAVLARYDKSHLVPFGEYTPLEDYIPALTVSAYQRGPGRVTMMLDKTGQSRLPSFSPLICYEVIFPGAVALGDDQRPDFLVNVTNDAWFASGSGPEQHLAMARWRAVEEGLMLMRAANTGISASIDPLGREHDRLELNQRGIIDVPLLAPLAPTWYARVGDRPFLLV